MRLRRIPGAQAQVQAHPLLVTEQQALRYPGQWQQLFTVAQPLHLELGMGRGHYLRAAAALRPDCNFLGLERRAEPLLSALEQCAEPYPPNLRLLQADAERLELLFAPGELDTLYLFFSDPWPKSRHSKRRLTAPNFIAKYQQILRPAGVVVFKTDGAAFYDWSRDNFLAAGWRIAAQSRDLPPQENMAMTSYEIRFRRLGQPIFYAEFINPRG